MPSPRASCSVVGERRVWFAGCDEGSRAERDSAYTQTRLGESGRRKRRRREVCESRKSSGYEREVVQGVRERERWGLDKTRMNRPGRGESEKTVKANGTRRAGTKGLDLRMGGCEQQMGRYCEVSGVGALVCVRCRRGCRCRRRRRCRCSNRDAARAEQSRAAQRRRTGSAAVGGGKAQVQGKVGSQSTHSATVLSCWSVRGMVRMENGGGRACSKGRAGVGWSVALQICKERRTGDADGG